jgi:hypothetical protein
MAKNKLLRSVGGGDHIASAKETARQNHVFFQPCAVSPPLLSSSLCPRI